MSNNHHNSNNGPELPHISTQDLQTATDYVNELIEAVRDARNDGESIDVEMLTMMTLAAIVSTDTEHHVALVQQSLLLSIAIQRLAA